MSDALGKLRAGRLLARIKSDESGDTLAFLFIWPIFFITSFLFLLHVFLINNSRAELEVAASKGLRAAWDVAVEIGGSDYAIDLSSTNTNLSAQLDWIENRARCAALASAGPLGDFESIPNSGNPADPTESCVKWASDNFLIDFDPDWLTVLAPEVIATTDSETGALRMLVSGTTIGPLASWWPSVIGNISAEVCAPLPVKEDQNLVPFESGVSACD